jgi:6-pyruvoyltetrahydropterin/6-carboxytetrahydropterin synthase
MYSLSIEKTISAAHSLRNYQGPCARLHGHNWKINVHVYAKQLNEIGIAIDFEELEKLTWEVIGPFDHQNLNDLAPFDKINPTAEHIVKYIYEQLKPKLPVNIHLHKVTLWESDKYLVAYEE